GPLHAHRGHRRAGGRAQRGGAPDGRPPDRLRPPPEGPAGAGHGGPRGAGGGMTDEAVTDKGEKKEDVKIPEVLPVLPLRDIVIFPFMIVPLYVSRERSIKAVDQALADNRMILLAAQ